jgi:arylsulfatase A-like enzyme
MIRFLAVFLVLLVAARALAAQTGSGQTPERPNFILILADDLGYGDAGRYKDPRIATPNLDRMAKEGVELASFYAAPTCTPARAALMTGRYPIRSGVVRVIHPGERFGIPESEVTLGEALKDQGYATALVGKWHLGGRRRYRPNRNGFDYFHGLLYSNDMTIMPPNMRRLRLYRNEEPIESPVKQRTLTKRYTEESLRFIEQNKGRPFLLYLAHTMPHFPPNASDEFRGKSGRGLYGDAVEEIDWSAGEILDSLERLGLDRKTLVIFTSDNGPALGKPKLGGSAGPLRGGKHTTWEGGVRAPFLARWPGRIPPGREAGGIASLMDLYTTLVELGGGAVPSDRLVDGRNISAMLEGSGASPHASHFFYEGKRIFAVRSGDWKLHLMKIDTGPKGPGKPRICDPPELYDLAEDLGEARDVAAGHPAVVKRLAALVQEFQESVEAGKLPPKRRFPL